VSISNPLISPRSKPPAQITYFPISLSKLTKTFHHYKVIKIINIILSVITTWNFLSFIEHNEHNYHLFAGLLCKNRVLSAKGGALHQVVRCVRCFCLVAIREGCVGFIFFESWVPKTAF
jgi:hypothetical protein